MEYLKASLSEPLFYVGLLCASVMLTCLAALVLIFRHGRRATRLAPRDPSADQTNMRILFQTMRDVLRSQKDLARQLNESIDQKIHVIKSVVAEARARQEEMGRTQEQLADFLRTAKADLNEILGNMGIVKEEAKEEAKGASVAAPDETQPEPPGPVVPERSPLLAIATSQDEPPEDDLIDNWVGLDFAGDAPDPHKYDIPEEPPLAPSDPEAARDAFRQLLNLKETPTAPAVTTEAPKPRPASGGNGRGKVTPVQARVYEYSDAGMTTTQISRELGMGKGEVRLILGLRKDRGL